MLADVVTILTEAAESEVLYPNYHRCKMLKVLCGYVEKVDVVGSRTFRDAAHKSQNGVNTAPLVLMVCLCTFCSHRWTESSTLPDIAADLQSIHRALGIAADQHVDFVLIRDDMVARQVRTGFR